MQLTLEASRTLALAVFLVLAFARVPFPLACLAAVVLPATRIDVRLSWQLGIVLAVVARLAYGAWHNQLANMAGKYFRDLIASRVKSLAYRVLGSVIMDDDGAPLPEVKRPSGRRVEVVRTAKLTGERLKALAPLMFRPGVLPTGMPAVVVDSGVKFQAFMGFGGAFTESSAELLMKMSPANQEFILRAYFDPKSGLGYRLGRLHMNSCDFSRGNWSCVDTPGDDELKTFSIDRYKAAILPMVRRAQEVAEQPLTLLASPWSPPGWMKDTGRMLQGGKLLPQYRQPWAHFYMRFAEAMKAEGLPLWGFTVQNEPQASTPWENCLYSHEEERDFVRDHLGPALEASGLDLKLIVWDHNRDDMFARAKVIYDDPVAAKYVWGVGYHWYGDPRYEMWPAREGQVLFDNLRFVHELQPEKHILMTEACGEFGPIPGGGLWGLAERYGEAILKDLNNWLEAWIDWNLILDATGGPNHVQNLVSAPIIADEKRDRVLRLAPFFYIGHFSRFIQPGARRILAASSRDALEATAFLNPDGTVAVVVLNRGDYGVDFALQHAGEVVQLQAPEHSITTLLFLDGPGRSEAPTESTS